MSDRFSVTGLRTVVTGAGPHSGGGPEDDVERLNFYIPDVARVHGTTVVVLVALVLVTFAVLRQVHAPTNVQQRLGVLSALLVAQATVGYVQYFNDIPALLVGIHIAGATAVWSAVVCFRLGLSEPVERATNVPDDGRAGSADRRVAAVLR